MDSLLRICIWAAATAVVILGLLVAFLGGQYRLVKHDCYQHEQLAACDAMEEIKQAWRIFK